MTSRDTARLHAERIADDANAVRAAIDAAWAALAAAQPGIRSTPTDAGSRSTGAPDDAMVAAALAYGADVAVRARRDLARRLPHIARDMAWLRATLAAWATPASAPAADIDRTCQACQRHGVIHLHASRRVGPMAVCRWAYDFHRQVGRLPSEDETHRHRDGRTVRVRAAEVERRAG